MIGVLDSTKSGSTKHQRIQVLSTTEKKLISILTKKISGRQSTDYASVKDSYLTMLYGNESQAFLVTHREEMKLWRGSSKKHEAKKTQIHV